MWCLRCKHIFCLWFCDDVPSLLKNRDIHFMINEKPKKSSFESFAKTRGFSLVELLAVIVIMVLLMTMGSMGIRSLTSGKGTSTGLANMESLFAEARATAIGKGVTTRVLIDARDVSETGTYLRKVVIATKEPRKESDENDTWAVTSRGYTLPEGVFFSKVLSRKSPNSSDPLEPDDLQFVKESDNGKYVSYEFNNQGFAAIPGTTFVIGAGVRPAGQEPKIGGSAKRDFAGFTIWSNGETSIFRNPSQISTDFTAITNF